ncbi:Putative peptidoglycan binding domain-containing protein [Oceanobacillus limi]|uniref:Putative peptidoglycan binding domain-containing protein n=1 Tax=Oceanobacillus limi TaxID=930131 RepID=A0A1H9ZDK2_9BACI|nr:NlpC/P60 family protein [Oceanobacillus limi]SES79408.1 Putative peptidoglycan binding domain-containing protein [Oceanobacillus limi]
MLNGTVERIAKHTFLYSYVISQPFAVYVDAYPVLQNKILLEAEEIKFGDHGESVKVLQQKLNKLSYYDDEIDGDLGLLTEHALKKFQNDHNIEITGQGDQETIYALIQVELKEHLKKLDHLSESIYPGLHSEDVKIVQESLQFFGYYEGKIDGIYGPLTKKALEKAEEEHDMDLVNEVTAESLSTLYETEQQEVEEEINNSSSKKESENVQKVEVKGSNHKNVIQLAQSLIGTPYVWGGTSRNGFDCSGFLQYIFKEQNIEIPRTVNDIWNFGSHVDAPSVGDLVFFETYKPGPSHAGIYIGNGKFIHAGTSNGVTTDELNSSYWQQRYLGAKRVH